MKRLPLYIAGAIVAEFIIIALATMLNLNGLPLYVAVGLLPVVLIGASIYFLIRPGTEPAAGQKDDDEADRKPG